MLRTILFLALALLPALSHADLLVQNAAAREGVSLDGDWARIVDPYENGYYDYRYKPHANGYFANQKPQSPSDLVEYDFSTSPTLRAGVRVSEGLLYFVNGDRCQ